MVLSEKLEKAINDQIKAELDSAYMYLSMSTYFESVNLPGFAHWMRVQTKEEMDHAMKFYSYIHERGGRVILQEIDKPVADYESTLAAMEKTYAHEQLVTSLIYNLYEMALEEKDHASAVFLQWYIDEQVEEEDNARTIVDQLKMIGDSTNGLIMLDRHLASRGS